MAQKIPVYEVPQGIVPKPSNAGYEAAMVSGRRIAGIKREGNADLKAGILGIGTAFDRAEARRDQAEHKREIAANKAERAEEKAHRVAARAMKERDAREGNLEIVRGIKSRAALTATLDHEKELLIRGAQPEDIPALLNKFQQDRVDPAYQEWTQQNFQTNIGQRWARQAYQSGMTRYQTMGHLEGGVAVGKAQLDALDKTYTTLGNSVASGHMRLEDAADQMKHAYNGVGATMTVNLAGGSGEMLRKTPNDVTEQDLRVFRTLEGNLSGKNDTATSNKGAVGRYQILPSTAADVGFPDADRLKNDTAYNTAAAKAEVSRLSVKYNGDLGAMVVGYHSGTGGADKWLAAGRDDSVLGPEGRKYIANARDHGWAGATQPDGTAAPPQMNPSRLNAQLSDRYKTDMAKLVHEDAMRIARTDPAAARAKLDNDPLYKEHLNPEQQASLRRVADVREQAIQKDAATQLTKDTFSYRTNALQTASRYVEELHAGASSSNDFHRRVQEDPRLTDGLKASLYSVQENFDKRQANAGNWFGPKPVVQDKADTVTGLMAGLQVKPTDPNYTTPERVINEIAQGHIKPETGSLIMKGLDPNNTQAQSELGYINRAADLLHEKLAPNLPDGSRNMVGEQAYQRAFQTVWKQSHDMALAGVPYSVSLDPAHPQSIIKPDAVSKMAATPSDIHKAAVPASPTTPVGDSYTGLEPKVNGTGKPAADPRYAPVKADRENPLGREMKPEEIGREKTAAELAQEEPAAPVEKISFGNEEQPTGDEEL